MERNLKCPYLSKAITTYWNIRDSKPTLPKQAKIKTNATKLITKDCVQNQKKITLLVAFLKFNVKLESTTQNFLLFPVSPDKRPDNVAAHRWRW